MIAIIDYQTGNLRSVENALSRLGAEYELTADPEKIKAADKVILPGVGEASSAMRNLEKTGLVEVIKKLKQPVLGICVGLQLMCKYSEEGDVKCMGIFDTSVRKFHFDDADTNPDIALKNNVHLKVPHMGWNRILDLSTPLFSGVSEKSYVYFIHSYAADLCNETIARTEYGVDFSAALNKDNFYGTQFHPEKSSDIGARVLKNFIEL